MVTGMTLGEYTATQMSFNPVDYGFEWKGDWYCFDSEMAHKKAKEERDVEAKRLRSEGYRIKKYSERNQLITRGGIGSGHPQIEEIVTVYMLLYWKD